MNSWWLLQVFVDVCAFVGLTVVWIRLRRPPQDDPRLSRGLQLLQSKISVLEDLSDRTDAQVKQLSHLIEQKARLLQNKIIESEHQIQRVDQSMKRSKEVAEIFQDKIPHQEIIERQNTVKYVTAAQMAHAGKTVAEIAEAVDLPAGQIELIAKLNREQLVFDPDALPEWARNPAVKGSTASSTDTLDDAVADADDAIEFASAVLNQAEASTAPAEMLDLFTPPQEEYASLKRVGAQFREAVLDFERQQQPAPIVPPVISEMATAVENSALMEGAKRATSRFMGAAGGILNQMEAKAKELIENPAGRSGVTRSATAASTASALRASAAATPTAPTANDVRTVEFPRIDVNTNLR